MKIEQRFSAKMSFDNIVPRPGTTVVGAPNPKQDQFPELVTGIPLYGECDAPEVKRFVVNGFQDAWAAILFLVSVLMSVVWGIVNWSISFENLPSDVDGGSLVGVMFLSGGLSLLAFGTLFLMYKFPTQMIIAANIASAAVSLIGGIVAFATGNMFIGALAVAMSIFQLVWLYLVRSRIPFSAVLLKLSTEVVMKYKGILVSQLGLVAGFVIYLIFWSSMTYPTFSRLSDEKQENPSGDFFLTCFFLLIFFWTSQVLLNVSHVTASGVGATWYFVAGHTSMPKNPTLASFRRAATTSFGSICFGSLILAFLNLLHWIAKSSRNNENDFVKCIIECIIGCIERAMEYFNHYAFVFVAIYGCSYIDAAKKTWELVNQCFWKAYFNDALVGVTITFASWGFSALVGAIAGAVAGSYALGIIVFFVMFSMHMIIFRAVESLVTTIFVCFATLPEALQAVSPELHAMLHAADNGQNA